jgi:hypothetical protein
MIHGAVTFYIKNESQKIILQCIGVDDMGFIMRPPIGESINNSVFGKILIDLNGNEYKVKSIAFHENVLWLG